MRQKRRTSLTASLALEWMMSSEAPSFTHAATPTPGGHARTLNMTTPGGSILHKMLQESRSVSNENLISKFVFKRSFTQDVWFIAVITWPNIQSAGTKQTAARPVKYMYLLLYSESISTRKAQNRLHSNKRTKQKQTFHVNHVYHVFFFSFPEERSFHRKDYGHRHTDAYLV